jgi:hypothetical protein
MDQRRETDQTQTEQQRDAAGGQRPSLTSPPGGRTHEATKPPGQGDVDQDAVDKSREGLERAGGGH